MSTRPTGGSLGWGDAAALAAILRERFPDVDPLAIRFPDLVRWVIVIDGFADPHRPRDWRTLEEIQRAWTALTTS